MKKEYQAKEVLDFLYNPLNERNCENCPYNEDYDDFQHRLPCGQWNCWVSLHCDTD